MSYAPVPHEFLGLAPKEITAYLLRELQQSPRADKIDRAVELAEWATKSMASPKDRITCCRLLARHFMYAGDFTMAHQWLRKAHTLAGSTPRLVAEVEIARATVFNAERRIDEAISRLEAVRRDLDPDQEPELLARALTILASAYDDKGESTRSDDAYAELLTLREKIGDESGLAVSYYNFAERCARRDDHATAFDYFMRAYDIEKRLGLQQGLAQTACQLALIEALRGHADEALRLSTEAVDLARSVGSPVIIAYCLANRCATLARLGMLEDERRELVDAIAFTEPYGLPHILGPIIGDYAEVLLKLGQVDESIPYFERAMKISKEEGYLYGEAMWCLGLGRARCEQHQYDEARTLLERAVQHFSDLGSHHQHLKAMFELAKAIHRSGQSSQGMDMFLQWMEQYQGDQERRQIAMLENVHRRFERERQLQEAEIYRLRNVELSAAMQKLQLLNSELQELAAEKDEFMAIAAHDLRSPLGNVRTTIMHAIAILDSAEPHEVRDVLEDVLALANRMLATVYNFLDVSRNDKRGTTLSHEIIDVTDVVQDCIGRHLERAQEKGIRLRLTSKHAVWAQADAAIVDAIADNLLSNAIKFSSADSDVVISTMCEADEVLIRVKDEGPGIPEEDRALLFTKYGRLSTKPTDGEGSLGLGLYLAARLAKRVNGSLTCESVVGSGSTFTIHLHPAIEAGSV